MVQPFDDWGEALAFVGLEVDLASEDWGVDRAFGDLEEAASSWEVLACGGYIVNS